MVSEHKREEIRKEARKILDKFGESLREVKEKVKKDEKSESYREEQKGVECEKNFRERMFENAPKKSKDCIVAERAKW